MQGQPRELSEPGDPTQGSDGRGTPTLPYIPEGEFPTKETTGITDYWCPRWDSLKTTTSSGVEFATDGQVVEYREFTDGFAEFRANNGVLRCSKVIRQDGVKVWFGGGYRYGALVEDVRVSAGPIDPGSGESLVTSGEVDAFTLSRGAFWPTVKDVMQNGTGFIIDSYLDTLDNRAGGEDPHLDVIQVSGGCGPQWYVHNTLVGCGEASCAHVTPGGRQLYANAVLFVKGRWSNSPCNNVPSMVIANNFISGGLMPSRWSDSSGRIINTAYWDNVWDDGTWYYDPCYHKWDGPYSMVTDPNPDPNGNEICVESDNNFTDTGVDLANDADCKFDQTFPKGSCVDIEPIPVTVISDFTLATTSCTRAQASCNDVTLSANASTNEGPRNLDFSSAPGGSFRWRYSCGGSPGNTSANPCASSGRCSGYEDNGADLWYHYPGCDGLSSCTMTDVCDFQDEPAGEYVVKIYAEAGPGAAYRPSGHDEAVFTVN